MLRLLLILGLSLSLVRCVTPPPPASDPSNPMCLGNPAADRYLIFLRGMDKVGSSAGEQSLRALFSRLATEHNMRIALPRATMPCPSDAGFRCWGWNFGSGDLNTSSKIIRDAAATCFPQGAPYGLLGFSNGGYLVSKLYRNCQLKTQLPQVEFGIVVGATALRMPIRDVAQDLSACGRFRILSGKKDTLNANLDGTYIRLLQSRGGDAEETLYDGGHTLPEKELGELLHQLLDR